ncbi:MAG: carboxypeptidase regulatory-like domain-containing protein, partial [Planctomycetota bacterium]
GASMHLRKFFFFAIGLCLTLPSIASETEQRRFILEIVDDFGDPVKGVEISRNLSTNEPGFERMQDYFSDEMGRVVIPLPKSMRLLRMWLSKEGHVPLFANWMSDSTRRIPRALIITMPQATTIGGLILDPNGNPIADASIEVRLAGGGKSFSGNAHIEYLSSLGRDSNAIRSDDQGRWSLQAVPPGDDVRVSLKVSHEGFIKDESWGGLQAANGVTTKQLREQTARIVMPEGSVMTGRLVDMKGQPISGAVVSWSREKRWNGRAQVTTDSNGNYQLPPLKPGRLYLAFTASNHQPTLIDVQLSMASDELETILPPGRELKLKVVDVNDVPISDATVDVERWKDLNSFISGRQCDLFDACGIEKTDDQGRTIWNSAPEEIVQLAIKKDGFSSEQAELVASDSEYTVQLYESLNLKGRIVDANSGDPILDALLVPVSYYVRRPDDPIVQRTQIRQVAGEFDFKKSYWDEGIDIVLQFEAPGYRPQRIGPFDKTAGTIEQDVQLQPASMLSGQVVDNSGAPVANANVSFSTKDTSLIVNDWTYRSDGLSTQTNQQGHFDLGATMSAPSVISTHEKGYAEVTLELNEQPGILKLEPWARVAGTLMRDNNPVIGERVYLRPIRMLGGDNPHVQDSFSTVTDGEGRFLFERVPPVPSALSSYVSVWRETKLTSSRHVPLDLKPGETREVTLGTGAVVRGRVQPSGDLASKLDMNYCLNYLLKRAPGITPPEPIQRAGFAWEDGWSFDYKNSQEGRGFLSTLTYHFVKFQSDGSFEIHGVDPGDYEFAISIYEPPEGCLIDPVGLEVVSVSVGPNDIDMRDINVDVQLGPKVGDTFPNFRFETRREGQTGAISDFRGRFLLIDFWATWCAPCVKQIPNLRSTVQRWNEDQVTVLSVSLDEDLDHARKFILERNMSWPQAMMAGRDGPIVRQQLGISSVPIHYVLDEEGRVLHRAFNLDEATSFIDQILEK